VPNITVGVANVFIPELWSDKVLKARERNLAMASRVIRLDDEVAKLGDTVHLPRFANRTASTKTANSAITYNAATNGEFVIGITTQAYDAVIIEDITTVQSKYNLMDLYTQKMGYALGQKLDSDLVGMYTGFGLAQTVGAVATSTGVRIAKSFILEAKRLLDAADAPGEDRYIMVDANGYRDLLNIDDFVRYDSRGVSNVIGKPAIGEIYGFEVVMSNQVPSLSSVAYALVWQKEAFALALQKDVTMKTEYSVDYIGNKVVAYNIYGYGVARTDHAVVLQYGIA
jgi:N4-gp56 family major capsid protein